MESARSWQPAVVLAEMTSDLRSLATLVDELRVYAPDTVIAAVFRADVFPEDVSESAVMIEAVRAGVQDFVRRPVSSNDLDAVFERLLAVRPTSRGRSGTVVSFVSNKGGVGKSTLAVNTACLLAKRHPESVLLVDLSLQMGVCSSLLDVTPETTIGDAARDRDRLDETLLRQLTTPHSSGLDLLAAPASPIEAGDVDEEVVSRVLTLARRAYDFVVVDTFPLLERVVTAVLDLSDRVFVVLDNIVPTVLSAARFVELLDSLDVDRDKRRVVLNRFTTGASSPAVADVEERLGVPVDAVVAHSMDVVAASNLGRPFVLTSNRTLRFGRRRSPTVALTRLVDEVESLRGERNGATSSENGRVAETSSEGES